MSTTRRNQLQAVFNLAWQMVKRNGFSLSEALKKAWANVKLVAKMHTGIVKFYFQKVDGSIREAYGTLADNMIPATQGSDRKKNDSVQVYYDTEKQEYRCYKKANLMYNI